MLLSGCGIVGNLDIPDVGFGEAGFAGPAKFDHRSLVAGESDPVVLEDDFSALAGNLKPISSMGFPGGGDKNTGRGIGPLKVSGDVVFDFDIVETAELAESAHAGRHSAEPDEQVDIVRALIEETPASLALPGGAPAAAGVVGFSAEPIGDDPTDACEFA